MYNCSGPVSLQGLTAILGKVPGGCRRPVYRKTKLWPGPGHGPRRLPGQVLFANRAEGPVASSLAQTPGPFREGSPRAHKEVGLGIDWGSRRVTLKGDPVELMTTYYAASKGWRWTRPECRSAARYYSGSGRRIARLRRTAGGPGEVPGPNAGWYPAGGGR